MKTTASEVLAAITLSAPDNRMETVQPSETLETLGFDSLDRFDLACALEEKFPGLGLETEQIAAWETVQNVVDDVQNALALDDGAAWVGPSDYGTPPINRIERKDVQEFHLQNINGSQLDLYQRIATKSAIYPGKGTPFGLMYAALGLAEAGEVQNKVKKIFRDDGAIEFTGTELVYVGDEKSEERHFVKFHVITPERRAQIVKELGGVLWYVAAVCDEIGATMSEVALGNLEELCGRTERGTLRGSGDDR